MPENQVRENFKNTKKYLDCQMPFLKKLPPEKQVRGEVKQYKKILRLSTAFYKKIAAGEKGQRKL